MSPSGEPHIEWEIGEVLNLGVDGCCVSINVEYVDVDICCCLLSSVAEVLFRTSPENQNRQNRTVKFGSVLFSPRNSWSCSVLGSYI